VLGSEGHTRIVLSKALTSSYPVYRFLATQFLETLLDQQLAACGEYEWIIRLLVTQIYDSAIVVRELAVRIVEHACQDSQGVLECLVSLRPELDHLGYEGAPLLFRFLSSSVGVRYLDEIGYIERGLEEWFTVRWSERASAY
jgi:rapamycin-insensitive companion of mTOR